MGHHRALMCGAALLASAWGADRDPAEVLRDAKAKVAARSASLPRYTCVEDIERHYYRVLARPNAPRGCSVSMSQRPDPAMDMTLRLSATDRLRIAVAVVGQGEIYSWAGASSFRENDSIEKLVRSGPIGTGVLAGIMDVVFLRDVQRFYFDRQQASEGGSIEYFFRVPTAGSHYRVRIGEEWKPVAYRGTVAVDAHTADVVRLMIDTGALPEATGMCQIQETVEFGTAEIAGKPFRLPMDVRQRFLHPGGGEVDNSVRLTSCREYAAESEIRFDPAEAATANGSDVPAAPAVLPEGVHFTLELESPIDTDHAAAGDEFRARLLHPIRVKKALLEIPSGAIVEGRMMRVETIQLRRQRVRLALSPRTILLNGQTVMLRATRDWKTLIDGAIPGRGAPEILLPLPGEGPSGVFEFVGQHVIVPKGFRSEWWSARVEAAK